MTFSWENKKQKASQSSTFFTSTTILNICKTFKFVYFFNNPQTASKNRPLWFWPERDVNIGVEAGDTSYNNRGRRPRGNQQFCSLTNWWFPVPHWRAFKRSLMNTCKCTHPLLKTQGGSRRGQRVKPEELSCSGLWWWEPMMQTSQAFCSFKQGGQDVRIEEQFPWRWKEVGGGGGQRSN